MQVSNCEFPDDVYIDVGNDVWLRRIEDSRAKIGITTVLSFLAGKINSVKLREDEISIVRGQTVATIESGKYFGPVRSPVSGKLLRFNNELTTRPWLLNKSPYDEGWMLELESFEKNELSRLGRSSEIKDKLQSRIEELSVHCFKVMPDEEMVSIRAECSTTLANLNKVLEDAPTGHIVHLVTDEPTAEIEMIRWSDQTKNEVVESRREGNLFHFIVEKKKEPSQK